MRDTGGAAHVIPTGTGKELNIYLSDFSVNRADLKSEHRMALDEYLLPILTSGGSANIIGVASRTGTWKHNLLLSNKRALNTENHIKAWGPLAGQLKTVFGSSEMYAAIHQADGTESAFYRAVWISTSPKKIPPPPPPPPRVVPVPPRYRCVSGALDREFYDNVNGKEEWLFKGAEGTVATLHNLIKSAEQEYSRQHFSSTHKYNTRTRDNVLLSFYKSEEFRLWYIEGFCGLKRVYKGGRRLKGAMDYIWYYNTVKGQQKKKVWDGIISKALSP